MGLPSPLALFPGIEPMPFTAFLEILLEALRLRGMSSDPSVNRSNRSNRSNFGAASLQIRGKRKKHELNEQMKGGGVTKFPCYLLIEDSESRLSILSIGGARALSLSALRGLSIDCGAIKYPERQKLIILKACGSKSF